MNDYFNNTKSIQTTPEKWPNNNDDIFLFSGDSLSQWSMFLISIKNSDNLEPVPDFSYLEVLQPSNRMTINVQVWLNVSSSPSEVV